jgi:hypothetical protein
MVAYMADKDKNKTINITLFFTIVITLMLSYLTLMNTSMLGHIERINKKIDQNFVFILELKEILFAHIGWHKGKGDTGCD